MSGMLVGDEERSIEDAEGVTDVGRPARNLSAGFDNQGRLSSSFLCSSVSRFILSLVAAGSILSGGKRVVRRK